MTIQNGGQVAVGGTLKLWKADSLVTVSGGTLAVGTLSGSTGTVRITDPAGGPALTTGSAASDAFSGTLCDDTAPGSLTKIGSGTQTLAWGGITYTGPTTVEEGALTLADASAFASAIHNDATTEFSVSMGTGALATALGGAGTFVKSGDGTLIVAGPQDYDVGALFDVRGGTVVLQTDAGNQGADLSISVTGAELDFACDQHLDTLRIGDGGKVVFAGAHVVVLNDLVMDGFDFGATTPTPEPTTMGLLALGGLAVMWGHRRRRS